jgi:neurotransmitter:Na+ symporter, NSS family
MAAGRSQFGSKFGFIMAAAGSAVGLGNIWGFPTQVASNGGAAFLLVYLVLTFLLAYPVLIVEMTIGRYSQSNVVSALGAISTNRLHSRIGYWVGCYAVFVACLMLSFYAIVSGWLFAYLTGAIASVFGTASMESWLHEFSISRNLIFAVIFASVTIYIVSKGIEKGIEKFSKTLMPILLVILIFLAGYTLTLPGAIEGLKVYLLPDIASLSQPKIFINALGQSFFSLSLGVGGMIVYGSYLSKQESIPKIGATVAVFDASIAFLAGLLIIPALFAAMHSGVNIYDAEGVLTSGESLIFEVLPVLFETMGVPGIFISVLFFFLLSIAALTSAISILEVPVSLVIEKRKIKRTSATALTGGAIFAVSAITIVYFDFLFPLILDFTTKYSITIISAIFCVYVGWLWKRTNLLSELQNGSPEIEQSIFWKIWPNYVKYVCPILITLIFSQFFI